jgi:dihydrofolate synthase / folylpolyglutamate synthase
MKFDVFNFYNQLIYSDLESQLTGNYQLNNIIGVLTAIQKLNEIGFKINENAIRIGFKKVVTLTGLKGRWQVLQQKPLMICDTAHNEHGLEEVLKQISFIKCNQKFFILGFVKDKNVEKILQLFPKDAKYVFTMADSPRSMSPENLIEIANQVHIQGYSILNVNDAIQNVLNQANPDDFIYIGGSTFVVAEINNL